jgi:hypothetical protein
VRNEGDRPGKQQEALHHVAESGETKGLREQERSQDQSRETGSDSSDPEFGVGIQGRRSPVPF